MGFDYLKLNKKKQQIVILYTEESVSNISVCRLRHLWAWSQRLNVKQTIFSEHGKLQEMMCKTHN